MRKITLLLFLVCSMSMFATRYLVQKGGTGDAEWRALESGEILVDLTSEGKTLNAWLSDNFPTSFPSNSEVWLIHGTYVFNADHKMQANFVMRGGFLGAETSIEEREKGNNPWDFINETMLDGNNSTNMLGCNGPRTVLLEGLTFTNGLSSTNAGAITLRPGVVVQNSKFLNNIATNQGGAINMNAGGEVYNSYFSGNEANMGGAIHTSGSDPTIISGCIFENNKTIAGANKQGGAIRSQSSNTVIENSTFAYNEADGNGSAIYTQVDTDKANKIINCLVYSNKTKSALYLRGAAVYNSTVVDNEAGAAYLATKDAQIYNSVFWGEDNAHASVTGANNSGNVFQNNAIITIPTYANWTISDNIALDVLEEGANYPHFANPLTNDWTITYLSPLLNAADKDIANTPSADLLGISRPQGSAYDIGAFELPYFNTVITMNEGGKVNGEDSNFSVSEPKGKPVTYTIAPDEGMNIISVKYNNVEVKDDMIENVYTAPVITSNSTLEVEFDLGTGLNQTNKQIFVCSGINNELVISGLEKSQTVSVYSITGSRLFNKVTQTSTLNIPLSRGIYLVKVDNQVTKVTVY